MRFVTSTSLALLLASGAVMAAEDYPSRTVTIVAPYSPGGATDFLARALATELQEIWGQTVVVENRPGAGSVIGTAHVAQAAPDGYTLLINTAAHTTAPAVQHALPYDPANDITPITMLATSPYVVVAGAGVEADTLSEFIAEAREDAKFFGTAGMGSSSHFTAELLIQLGEITDYEIIHFSGGGEAQVSLMGGHADIFISTTASVMPYVNNEQVKALGVLGPDRYELLPDVESSAEAGIEGIEVAGWNGIFGPGGMDADLVRKISEDIHTATRRPGFSEVLETNFVRPGDMTPVDFQQHVAMEVDLWSDLAEQRSIVAE